MWVPLPTAVGVYVTEHLPVASRVQLVAGVKPPAPSVVQLTVPVGVLALPPLVSVTVAVQEVESFTATEAGVQLTLVVVARLVTVTTAVPVLPV